MKARRHRHGASSAGPRAVHIERRVADDRHPIVGKGAPRQRLGSRAGDRGQTAPVRVVGAERADAEQRPQPGRAQLHAGARLDVAGEQADQRVLASAELSQHLGHSGHDLNAAAIADDGGELTHVGGEARVESRADRVVGQAGRAHETEHDVGIRAPAEVERVDRPRRPIDLGERLPDGGSASATGGHERAVDVEQEEVHR